MSVERAAFVAWVCAATAAAQQQPEPQLARVACDASYNAPCSRTNSEFLALEVARNITERVAAGESSAEALARITAEEYNIETGFYPFVVDAATSVVLAHGKRPDLVGQSLESVFATLKLQYSDPELLHARLVAAASTPAGQWVQYVWPKTSSPGQADDEEVATGMEAFVVGMTREDGSALCLGVGFADTPLPPELPCSDKHDSFCAMNNVRSLVGKAQTLLSKAESQANFEEALLQLSYAEDDVLLPSGFYIFTYSFQGPLVSHAHLHNFFGQTLDHIFVANHLGTSQEGAQLHQAFVAAAEGEGDGWVRYEWRNSLDEDTYTKIALVAKVQFNAEMYYVGAGFNFAMESAAPDESEEIRVMQSADVVAKLGALGEPCSDRYNLPCSVVNTLQLSSHALAHAISSTASAADTFGAITSDPTFREGDFYAFVFEFSGRCVAHGAHDSFVGMTLRDIMGTLNMPDSILSRAAETHQRFKAAAEAGGGWVEYEWAEPGQPSFQKVAYIFSLHRDGIEYYGGVGYSKVQEDFEEYLAEGTSKSGARVSCTAEYGTDCSEKNALSILGQVLTNLIMAASGYGTDGDPEQDLLLEMHAIGAQSYNYADYHVSLFEISQTTCDHLTGGHDDHLSGSGCCLTHGKDSTWQYKTWQEILDANHVSSVLGPELHERLTTKANAGGGWIEYSWNAGGISKTKKAWVSPSTTVVELDHLQLEAYLVVEYFQEEAPPTCDTCPDDSDLELGDWHCTEPEQEFCQQYDEPPIPGHIKFILWLLVVALVFGAAFVYWYRERSKARNAEKRQHAMALARENLETALEEQKAEMEKAMAAMEYPDEWVRRDGRDGRDLAPRGEWLTDEDGTPRAPPVIEGLVPVPIESREYWDVHDKLRKRPADNPLPQSQVDQQGPDSVDRTGMQDAWISTLHRVQNPQLYTYFDFQRRRLADPARRTPDVLDGWHGTGTFDAANIYEDKQDGFMMQFASKGQFGKGLYFAEEPGYSHFYATQPTDPGAHTTQPNDLAPDERVFMLANVLMGEVVEMDRDSSPEMRAACNALVAPPFQNAPGVEPRVGAQVARCTRDPQGAGSNPKFNTVQGFTQCILSENCPRSKIWVVYENGRAYPQYVIRYYRGARDPTRTRFASAADAGVGRARTPAGAGIGGVVNPVHQAQPAHERLRRHHQQQQQSPPPLQQLAAGRPGAPARLAGPRVAAVPTPYLQWVVASQGLVPGAATMTINGTPTPNAIVLRDGWQVEEAWQRGRASAEYTGENGQRYVLTFADMVQRNKDTGNPSRAHRLVNGSDSTWYAKVLGPREPPGPNGERQFYVEQRTGRTVWTPNRLCPAAPLTPARKTNPAQNAQSPAPQRRAGAPAGAPRLQL